MTSDRELSLKVKMVTTFPLKVGLDPSKCSQGLTVEVA